MFSLVLHPDSPLLTLISLLDSTKPFSRVARIDYVLCPGHLQAKDSEVWRLKASLADPLENCFSFIQCQLYKACLYIAACGPHCHGSSGGGQGPNQIPDPVWTGGFACLFYLKPLGCKTSVKSIDSFISSPTWPWLPGCMFTGLTV